MPTQALHPSYDTGAGAYAGAHNRWLRYAGGEAQCAFEGAVAALLKPGARVLDAACGTGQVARRLLAAEAGLELVLLDASHRMLRHCEDIPAPKVAGCMSDLTFKDEHFDMVICAWGLEVLPDPAPALTEFLRVTRSGGHVCLVFCADRPARSVIGRALREHVSWSGRGRFLDHRRLERLALAKGARKVQHLHCTGPAAAMIVHV